MLNTLPTHPQSHFQQLSSLTQHQQRPGNKQNLRKTGFPLCKQKQRKMRNRPLVTDKTQPQRCQERAGLKDNTTHTPYMEFLTFFLIHNTPNEVCKQAKIEKIEKNSWFSASEPITVTEGRRGNVRVGMRGERKIFYVPKRFLSAQKPRKVDYFTHLLCYFLRYFTFSFLWFCDCFFRSWEAPFSTGTRKIENLRLEYLKNGETREQTLWRPLSRPYGGAWIQSWATGSQKRSQYSSRNIAPDG